MSAAVTTLDKLDALRSLMHDGYTATIGAVRFTLTVEPDDSDTVDEINGVDCYGEVAYEPERRTWQMVYPPARPRHFDGRARKIQTAYGVTYWWQPTIDTADPAAELPFMRALLEDGFKHASLSAVDAETGERIGEASLYGIDEMYPDVAPELAAEALAAWSTVSLDGQH